MPSSRLIVDRGASAAAVLSAPVRRRRRGGRDRRGRGLRGPLGPASLPMHRSRAERFDELVLDVVERLEHRWERALRTLEFAVEDVPVGSPPDQAGRGGEPPWLATSWAATSGRRTDPADAGAGGTGGEGGEVGAVALGRLLPATRGLPARVVIYRRPLELRAEDRAELAELVHSVVVEQVAEFLGLPPRDVDPDYDPHDED